MSGNKLRQLKPGDLSLAAKHCPKLSSALMMVFLCFVRPAGNLSSRFAFWLKPEADGSIMAIHSWTDF